MRIKKITANDNYTLQVMTEGGCHGLFDVKPYLNYEAFQQLKNKDEFKKVINGKYFIEWECGADLSADTIEAHLTPLTSNAAMPV